MPIKLMPYSYVCNWQLGWSPGGGAAISCGSLIGPYLGPELGHLNELKGEHLFSAAAGLYGPGHQRAAWSAMALDTALSHHWAVMASGLCVVHPVGSNIRMSGS